MRRSFDKMCLHDARAVRIGGRSAVLEKRPVDQEIARLPLLSRDFPTGGAAVLCIQTATNTDPACGSGTFLFAAIRRIIAAAEEAGWDSQHVVEHVQNHVFGLDIHPVSVLLARVTHLLALGDYLQDRGDLWVPVHLGDSMQWSQPDSQDEDMITISTEGVDLAAVENATLFSMGDTLKFPLDPTHDTDTFDQLVTALTERAKEYTSLDDPHPSVKPILRDFGISQDQKEFQILEQTFNTLCDLTAEGRDSIWGFYTRNQVRPLWLSMPERQVDVLIGNPPWVTYREMTPALQEQYRAFAQNMSSGMEERSLLIKIWWNYL